MNQIGHGRRQTRRCKEIPLTHETDLLQRHIFLREKYHFHLVLEVDVFVQKLLHNSFIILMKFLIDLEEIFLKFTKIVAIHS